VRRCVTRSCVRELGESLRVKWSERRYTNVKDELHEVRWAYMRTSSAALCLSYSGMKSSTSRRLLSGKGSTSTPCARIFRALSLIEAFQNGT
jgi:hypothetical protein